MHRGSVGMIHVLDRSCKCISVYASHVRKEGSVMCTCHLARIHEYCVRKAEHRV